MTIIVGTAGWSLAAQYAGQFPGKGTSLQRYAARFDGVEINSSFHRPHRPSTWARWGESVPASFRFAVKIPKTITHIHKLADSDALVDQFLGEVGALGDKLAVLLVQLPPKLAFGAALAEAFFARLGAKSAAQVVCEPRHPSWFERDADALLERCRVARVAADPAPAPAAALPGGWRGLSYVRLHGSPRMYWSRYEGPALEAYAKLVAAEAAERPTWCMFDNTASSAATGDALELSAKLDASANPQP